MSERADKALAYAERGWPAAPRIFSRLGVRLPTPLRCLPAATREAIGKAIDAGTARLLLDHRGEIVVARRWA